LNYEGSKLKKLSTVVLNGLFQQFPEIILASYTLFLGDGFPVYFLSSFTQLTIIIIFSAAFLLSPHLLKPFSFLRKNEELPPLIWITIIISLFCFLILNYLPHVFLLDFYLILIMKLTLFVSFLLIMYLLEKFSITYEKQLESARYQQEKEYYHIQYQLIKETIETTREMKHDLNLHLNSLNEQLKISPEQAESYLNKLLKDNEKNTFYSYTGNIAFDSIINYKLGVAAKNDISLNINMKIPSELDIEPTDVTIILGNLLDNAIQATGTAEMASIHLDINYQKGRLFITIENTFDGLVNYKGNQIVSRYDEEKRGLGLKSIRKAVERYNGEMNVTHTDTSFLVTILLYV